MSEEYVKINPLEFYRTITLLLGSEELIPIAVQAYKGDDRLKKSIELQTRIKMLQTIFLKAADDMDSSIVSEDEILDTMLQEATEACKVLYPRLTEEDKKSLEFEEQQTLIDLAEEFQRAVNKRIENSPEVIEGMTDQELEDEVLELRKSFEEQVKPSQLFGQGEE